MPRSFNVVVCDIKGGRPRFASSPDSLIALVIRYLAFRTQSNLAGAPRIEFTRTFSKGPR
jgi:hypothetical protein